MSALYGIGDPNGGDLPTSSGTPQVMGPPPQPMVTFEPTPAPAAPAVEVAPSTPPVMQQSAMVPPAPAPHEAVQQAALAPPAPPAAQPQKAESGGKALTVIIGLLGLIALSYWLERATKR